MFVEPAIESFGTNKVTLAMVGLFALFDLSVPFFVFLENGVDRFGLVFALVVLSLYRYMDRLASLG